MNHPMVPASAVHFTASSSIMPAKYSKQGMITRLSVIKDAILAMLFMSKSFNKGLVGDYVDACSVEDFCVNLLSTRYSAPQAIQQGITA